MPHLVTTLGKKSADELGMILPHEHVFVDLRTWDKPGYGEADPADVIAMMQPEIEKIKTQGITALVECSTLGVGRRADLDRAVSEAAEFPIVVPTGVYREPWLLPWMHDASTEALVEWMSGELEHEIEGSGVQAGWIKVSAGDDGITPTESKVLHAAAQAAARVNAVIGSHTIRGRVAKDQLDIIESAGYTPNRFIWIHTQAEPDFDLHLMMAKRGAWLEYDSIGNEDDEKHLTNILKILDAGFSNQLLLSHDRGWYDPASPGSHLKPYTYLVDTFLPKLSSHGVDEATIRQLTHTNPFSAFARF
ncbi:MAG: esterase [Anaerolineae bacterium]|nr:esterase [Anaerolineae bacterium]